MPWSDDACDSRFLRGTFSSLAAIASRGSSSSTSISSDSFAFFLSSGRAAMRPSISIRSWPISRKCEGSLLKRKKISKKFDLMKPNAAIVQRKSRLNHVNDWLWNANWIKVEAWTGERRSNVIPVLNVSLRLAAIFLAISGLDMTASFWRNKRALSCQKKEQAQSALPVDAPKPKAYNEELQSPEDESILSNQFEVAPECEKRKARMAKTWTGTSGA